MSGWQGGAGGQSANVPAPAPLPVTPNLTDFVAMLQNEMAVDVTTLNGPVNQIVIARSFDMAQHYVLREIALLDLGLYARALYCFAADRFLNFAVPVVGAPTNEAGVDCITQARRAYSLGSFTAGVINSASDNGTAGSITVPEGLKNLSLIDLQALKTPWGREYLGLASSFGPLWGMS